MLQGSGCKTGILTICIWNKISRKINGKALRILWCSMLTRYDSSKTASTERLEVALLHHNDLLMPNKIAFVDGELP